VKHPLANIPAHKRPLLFWLCFGLTMAVMVTLNVTGMPLQTAAAPVGIVSFELAGNVSTAQTILASWDEAARIYAGFNLGLDYLFLVLYSTTIALAILWLADSLKLQGWSLALATWLAWGQWLAAALDAVENGALLVMLVGEAATPWPQVAFWTAVVKFALIALGLLYVVAALTARRLAHQARQKPA
jgi:hypothetical protein